MVLRALVGQVIFKLPKRCLNVSRFAPVLSAVDTNQLREICQLKYNLRAHGKGIFNSNSLFPHFIIGTVGTDPLKKSQPIRYDIGPGKHHLIVLRTIDDSPDAVLEIPDSGVKNFNLAMERGRLLFPKSSAVIAKVPDSVDVTIQYEDLKGLPLKNVFVQSFECNPGSKEKISVLAGHSLESSKALGIPTVDDYIKANLKDLHPEKNPFTGEDHFKEMHNLLCKTCGGATTPTLYPEGIDISLMKEGNNDWFFRDLPDVLGYIRAALKKIAGVLTSYVYFGTRGCAFPYHKEDGLLYSINVMLNVIGLPGQGEKMWLSFHIDDVKRLEKLLKEENKGIAIEILSKGIYIKSLEALAANGIRFQLLRQMPKTVVFTYGPHSGFNTGNVVNEALNAAPPEWLGLNFRFPEDVNLLKPTRNSSNRISGNAYKLSPIQISKDFSIAGSYTVVLDGQKYTDDEPAIPAWGEDKKMRQYYLISQILIHKFRDAFKDESFVEARRIIQAMVAFRLLKLLNSSKSLSGIEDWVQVRRIMGAKDFSIKSRRRNKVGEEEEDSGYESALEDYIKKFPDTIFRDDTMFHEDLDDTLEWAKKMFNKSKHDLKPLMLEYKRLFTYSQSKIHELLAIYLTCMKEQRENDPDGTWTSTDGDTDFGREVRRNNEKYKNVINALKKPTTKRKSRQNESSAGNEEEMQQFNQHDSQVGQSFHNVQFDSPQGGEPEIGAFEIGTFEVGNINLSTMASSKSFAAYFKDLDQESRLVHLEDLVSEMSPYEREYCEKRFAELDKNDRINEEEEEEEEEEEVEYEALIPEVTIVAVNDENEEDQFQIGGDMKSDEIEMEQIHKEELQLGGGVKSSEIEQTQGDEEKDKQNEPIEREECNEEENEKDVQDEGVESSEEEEIPIQLNVSPIASHIKPISPVKIPTVKFDTSNIVPEKLTQYFIDSQDLFIKQLMAHLQEDELSGHYPPVKIASMSGLLFETIKGNTKTLVPNSNYYVRLFDVLAKGVKAEKFSSLLEKNKVTRLEAWEEFLGDSKAFSNDEVDELVDVIMTALNVDGNEMGIGFERLNAILRILINMLWISAGNEQLSEFNTELKWLLESVEEHQTEEEFINSFKIPKKYESNFPEIQKADKWDAEWKETKGFLAQFPHHIIGYEAELFMMTAKELPREIAIRNYVIAKMGAEKDEKEVHSPPTKRVRV